ncbi:hypothetical protein ACTXG7_25495 [Mycolicibacterium sp. Dal123E01]|uniref:hypothetical protein n=1 Tax=Mycolicibacterium sp. Dal123E01 TaxID=3457578 RepID=UPI00403E43F1
MATTKTATTKTAMRGRNRTLGVRTWLGAGAVTLGVGAALAGATAVAQAETSGHQAPSSASSSSSSKPDTGPKRGTGVVAPKRPVATVANARPAASDTRSPGSAKSAVAAVQTQNKTQTIKTPFGPITVAITSTIPDPGESGPVAMALDAATPLGGAAFALSGHETFTLAPSPKAEISLDEGKLVVPAPVALVASSAGAAVLGAMSVYNSATSFFTAVQHGNILGAAQALLEGAPKLTNAVLFGQESLTLPIDLGQGGQSAELSIPFGGVFAPLKPVTVTWAGYSYVDASTGAQVTIDPVDVNFAGTKFGGVAPALLQLFGI